MEIKWNAYRKRTQRLETEISLKKTETNHQAIQVDAHINRRLSTCNSIRSDKDNDPNIMEVDAIQEQMGTRRKRRDSVVKWIGRLSMNSSSEEKTNQLSDHELVTTNVKEGTKIDNSDNNNIEDRDEEVQGELQVLNLLSLVKIEQPESDETLTSKAGPPSSTLKLKVDPSPLLYVPKIRMQQKSHLIMKILRSLTFLLVNFREMKTYLYHLLESYYAVHLNRNLMS